MDPLSPTTFSPALISLSHVSFEGSKSCEKHNLDVMNTFILQILNGRSILCVHPNIVTHGIWFYGEVSFSLALLSTKLRSKLHVDDQNFSLGEFPPVAHLLNVGSGSGTEESCTSTSQPSDNPSTRKSQHLSPEELNRQLRDVFKRSNSFNEVGYHIHFGTSSGFLSFLP